MWTLRPDYMLASLAAPQPRWNAPDYASLLRCRCCGASLHSSKELELHYMSQHREAITRTLQEAPWSEIQVATALVAHFLLCRPPPLVS